MSDSADATSEIHVRPAEPGDHSAIGRVVADAFGSDVEAALVERIRSSPEYESSMELVAVADDDRVVGHVMISRALMHSEGTARSIAMLSPLSVAPNHQRCGVGRMLVHESTQIADRQGEPIVVLEGDPRYYSKLGFVAAGDHGITMPLPDWAPVEAAQVMLLTANDPADRTLRGRVEYPVAFDGLD